MSRKSSCTSGDRPVVLYLRPPRPLRYQRKFHTYFADPTTATGRVNIFDPPLDPAQTHDGGVLLHQYDSSFAPLPQPRRSAAAACLPASPPPARWELGNMYLLLCLGCRRVHA